MSWVPLANMALIAAALLIPSWALLRRQQGRADRCRAQITAGGIAVTMSAAAVTALAVASSEDAVGLSIRLAAAVSLAVVALPAVAMVAAEEVRLRFVRHRSQREPDARASGAGSDPDGDLGTAAS